MRTELAAIEGIRKGYKGKPLVKKAKKLPPFIKKKKEPSSAKKARQRGSNAGVSKVDKVVTSGPEATHLHVEGTDELHKLTPGDKKAIKDYVKKNPGTTVGRQFRSY